MTPVWNGGRRAQTPANLDRRIVTVLSRSCRWREYRFNAKTQRWVPQYWWLMTNRISSS